jgi:hypothetical protein
MLTPKGADITTVMEEIIGVTGTAENAKMTARTNAKMTARTTATAGVCNTGKKVVEKKADSCGSAGVRLFVLFKD